MTGLATEEFKMTELGPLPIEWGVAKFGELVAEITTGDWGETNPGNDLQKCYVLRGTDFSRVFKGSFANIPIRYLRPSSLQKRRLCKGDILIELSGGSKDQPTGRVAMVTGELISRATLPLVFSNFVKHLSVKTSLLPEFCWHYWEFLYQSGVTRTYEKRTTGIRNFKLNDFLASEYIPLPPLPEQKKIAYVLSSVQTSIEKTEATIKAARELKKSLMKHLFTYGPVTIDEAENVPLKETEIGMVLEEWETINLGNYCNFATGKLNSNQGVPNGMYPFFTCSQETYRIDRYSFDCEAVLLSGNNARGIYSVKHYSGKFDAYQRTYVITIKDTDRLNYIYLKNALEMKLEDLRIGSIGTSTKFLTLKMLLNLRVPFPPLPVQVKIANLLARVEQKIETEENKKGALEALFKTLLSKLMTGRIRVNNLEALV